MLQMNGQRTVSSPKTWVAMLAVAIIMTTLPGPWQAPAHAATTSLQVLQGVQDAIVELSDRVTPGVVNISRMGEVPPQRQQGSRRPTPGTGSGAIIDKGGYIVTNNHVVGEAEEVQVRLWDKSNYTGKVIGRDPDTDLAIVKIETDRDLTILPFADSSKVRVGQFALAVGNPFGLDRTVTLGVVSGLGRQNMNITRYERFIQTDASINPGNSGGPLFNLHGEVIGINTAIINAAQGIGFSIPSNFVKQIANQLMTHGKVTRGWLGVGIQLLTAELAEKLGAREGDGVLISDVFKGDPAFEAGLQPGDIITKVNGEPVTTPNELSLKIAGLAPSETAHIEFIRDSQTLSTDVVLGQRKDEVVTAAVPPSPEQPKIKLGMSVQDIVGDLEETYKGQTGVVVAEVEGGGPAEAAGIQKGDLIKEIDRKAVNKVSEFTEALKKSPPGHDILLRIIRDNRALFLVVKPDKG